MSSQKVLPSNRVIDEVIAERVRQATRWTPEHDDLHTIYDWCLLIERRTWSLGGNESYPDERGIAYARRQLIEIAAIAVAAIGALDRRRKRDAASHP
jgi:hypothetical protein